jgi:hypothetical protein
MPSLTRVEGDFIILTAIERQKAVANHFRRTAPIRCAGKPVGERRPGQGVRKTVLTQHDSHTPANFGRPATLEGRADEVGELKAQGLGIRAVARDFEAALAQRREIASLRNPYGESTTR